MRALLRMCVHGLVTGALLPACYLAHGIDGDDARPDVARARSAQLALGERHACVLLGDGSVHCWGDDALGQLGAGAASGPREPRREPARVEGLPPIVQLAAGGAVTCALDERGRVHCWGDNTRGQLGIGLGRAPHRCASDAPAPASGGGGDCAVRPMLLADLDRVVQIGVGATHGCALREGGSVLCWGFIALDLRDEAQAPPPAIESGAELAASDYAIVGRPVLMRGVAKATQIAVGASRFGPGHTCALLADGGLQCWGNRTFGQTGPVDGGLDAREPLPPELDRFALDAATLHVAAGVTRSCAATERGEVFCWGRDVRAELGGTGGPGVCDAADVACDQPGVTRIPVRAPGIEDAVAVSIHGSAESSDLQTCALRAGATVACWHDGRRVDVPGLSNVVDLAGNCATVRDGGVWCWQPRSAPVLVREVELAAAASRMR